MGRRLWLQKGFNNFTGLDSYACLYKEPGIVEVRKSAVYNSPPLWLTCSSACFLLCVPSYVASVAESVIFSALLCCIIFCPPPRLRSGLSECSGALVGLVVITPSAGYVTPGAAFAIGVVGAAVCFHAQKFAMPRTGVDDGVDCFTIHGVGGIVGFIMTAGFACPQVS